jgi:hypothetical protein
MKPRKLAKSGKAAGDQCNEAAYYKTAAASGTLIADTDIAWCYLS